MVTMQQATNETRAKHPKFRECILVNNTRFVLTVHDAMRLTRQIRALECRLGTWDKQVTLAIATDLATGEVFGRLDPVF
jgi:hypothetical protein